MARASKRKSGGRRKQSDIFTRIGAAWENETKSGDALIGVRIDIESFLDWLDEIKFEQLPDEGTKIKIVLLENTKYPGKGQPDFAVFGSDVILEEANGKEEEEKPRRGKKKVAPKKKARGRKEVEEPEEEEEGEDLNLELED